MRKLPTEDLDRVRENEVQNGPFHFSVSSVSFSLHPTVSRCQYIQRSGLICVTSEFVTTLATTLAWRMILPAEPSVVLLILLLLQTDLSSFLPAQSQGIRAN